MEQQLNIILPYSPEWYAERLGRFTSSEIHKLMGEPRSTEDKKNGLFSAVGMTYINEKIAEKLTGRMKPEPHGDALDWGHAHEEEALQAAANCLEIEIAPSGFVQFGAYAGGTPDGLGSDLSVIEAKCPYNSANHIQILLLKNQEELKKVKPEYFWQITANCHFTGLSKGYLVSYDPRQIDACKCKIIEVVPTESDIELMKEKLKKAIDLLKKHYYYLSTLTA